MSRSLAISAMLLVAFAASGVNLGNPAPLPATPAGLPVSAGTLQAAMAPDALRYVVAWKDSTGIRATRLGRDRQPLDVPPILIATPKPYLTGLAAVIADGTGFAVIHNERTVKSAGVSPYVWRYYFTAVDASGAPHAAASGEGWIFAIIRDGSRFLALAGTESVERVVAFSLRGEVLAEAPFAHAGFLLSSRQLFRRWRTDLAREQRRWGRERVSDRFDRFRS